MKMARLTEAKIDTMKKTEQIPVAEMESGEKDNPVTEERTISIYGYSEKDLSDIIKQFRKQLPEFVTMETSTVYLVTTVRLRGSHHAVELLRFKMNRLQQQVQSLFSEEIVTMEGKSMSQVLGQLLLERDLTVSCAESCTGGNIAHKITQNPGSSAYFMGSVVSYSNDVKADVLKVSRSDLGRFGAVSKPVAEQMAKGAAKLMRTDCAMATTGIAGPDGGTKFKPVGTVWIAARYNDQTVSEMIHFNGDRNQVIESATNHAMFMLIKLLRNSYTLQEEINDD